jgi:hypothetical protein
MSTRTQKVLKSKKFFNTNYWRWQFLRLNEEYRQAYNWYVEYRKTLGNEPALEELDKSFIAEIFEDYGLNKPYDYRKKLISEDCRIEGEDPPAQKGTIENVFKGRCKKNQRIDNHFLIEILKQKDKNTGEESFVMVQKYVNVVLNCDFAIEDVQKAVAEIYQRTRQVRRRHLSIARVRKINREDIKELKKCLMAYEMRMNGSKWTVMGAKLYPDNSLYSREDRARKNYKKACRLIAGDYKLIVV